MLVRSEYHQVSPIITLPFSFPKIITLCGSTRFKDAFIQQNHLLTKAGNLVFSVGWFSHSEDLATQPTNEEKKLLDEVHKRKIDLSDEILVLNCKRYRCRLCKVWLSNRGKFDCDCERRIDRLEAVYYIGDSTRSEIEYATANGKVVKYLHPQE